MKQSLFGFIDLPIKQGLKIQVFLICTMFCIVMNSFLNKQNKKNFSGDVKLSRREIEVISLNNLLNYAVSHFSTQRKLSAEEQNYPFHTRIILVIHRNLKL